MLGIISAKNKKGQSIVEYSLAPALVTLAVVTVLTQAGQNLSVKYVGIDQSIKVKPQGALQRALVDQAKGINLLA